jgi:predicted protein tyrosine phosphatase
MAKSRRVLLICEGNLHRSPTAERLYSATPSVKARSAGLSSLARVQVTEELLAWADVVFVMDRRLSKLLRRRFAAVMEGKELVCLDVPDDFQFLQPELLALLTERLVPWLGPPGSPTEGERQSSGGADKDKEREQRPEV